MKGKKTSTAASRSQVTDTHTTLHLESQMVQYVYKTEKAGIYVVCIIHYERMRVTNFLFLTAPNNRKIGTLLEMAETDFLKRTYDVHQRRYIPYFVFFIKSTKKIGTPFELAEDNFPKPDNSNNNNALKLTTASKY